MSTTDEHVLVSFLPEGTATACDLCDAEGVLASATIVVQHPQSGSVHFSACDWCAHAIRRLAIMTGGLALFALAEKPEPPPRAPTVRRRGRPTTAPVLILQFPQHVRDATTDYVVRVLGRERVDRTWEAWLEFVAVGAPTLLRTLPEATRSSREDLVDWAKRLKAAYLQAAFERVQRESSATSNA